MVPQIPTELQKKLKKHVYNERVQKQSKDQLN